jgi:hypothetical protein
MRRKVPGVPCWIYLRGDEDPIVCNEPADAVLKRIEQSAPDAFIHIVTAQLARDDEPQQTGYVLASGIVAVLPMHPRQFEAQLDDPPDWY